MEPDIPTCITITPASTKSDKSSETIRRVKRLFDGYKDDSNYIYDIYIDKFVGNIEQKSKENLLKSLNDLKSDIEYVNASYLKDLSKVVDELLE